MRYLLGLLIIVLSLLGCRTEAQKGPPVPASHDPEGKDLVEGAIVAAYEKAGGVRLYKIKLVRWFPPPMSEELEMLAYKEKGNDFKHAAALWQKGGLTLVLSNVRVPRHAFMQRDYRVIANEPVTPAELSAKPSASAHPQLKRFR